MSDVGEVLYFDGNSWKIEPTQATNFSDVWGVSSSEVYAVGNDGVYFYDGSTWSLMPGSPSGYSIWAYSSSDIFVSTTSAYHVSCGARCGYWAPLAYHYDGTSWNQLNANQFNEADYQFRKIRGSSPGKAYIAGKGFSDYWAANKNTVSVESQYEPVSGEGIWRVDNLIFVVGGYFSNNRVWTGGAMVIDLDVILPGFQSSSFSFPNAGWLQSVHGFSSTNVFAVGANGNILNYKRGAWVQMSSPTNETLTGVHCVSINECFAVGYNGTILQSKDWSKIANLVAGSPPGVINLSTNQALTYGGTNYTLQGTVNAAPGDTLTQVTASVTGPGISSSNSTAMTSGTISATTFDLSSGFIFDLNIFNQVGTYEVAIWATSTEYQNGVLLFKSGGQVPAVFDITVSSQSPLPAPANPATSSVTEYSVTLSWDAVGTASGYRIVMCDNQNFSGYNDKTGKTSGGCATKVVSTTSETVNTKLPSGTAYWWKVRAGKPGTGGVWSNVVT